MNPPAISATQSWLNAYDPANPSSAAPLLNASITDPIDRTTPAGFGVLEPAPVAAAAGPSTYQQAIDAFTVTADSFLIQSAIDGYQPLAAPAAFGSAQAQFASLGNTIDVLENAALSGNYGSLNTLA